MIRRTLTVAALATVLGAGTGQAQMAADQAPGARFEIRAQDLPPPYATGDNANGADRIRRPPGATLNVPPGFVAQLFAEGLAGPRELAWLPDGSLLVSEPSADRITRLADRDGDGVAEERTVFAEFFSLPYGLVVRDGAVYVADSRAIWRLDLAGGNRAMVTGDGVFGEPGGHSTRSLALDPAGQRFYVGVGSAGNIREEAPPRATVQEFGVDGRGQRTFATGLRNTIGIEFRPGSRELWGVVNERDGLGDDLVPDYLTQIRDGAFYGWPYSYVGQNPQPRFAERRPDLVAQAVVPDVLFQAHSAPIDVAFYTGAMFPEDYRGDAFVSLHGSWNRATPTGYKVVRVPFENGRPLGWYENFATGFWMAGPTVNARVWGRPAGLTVAPDGALIIADDTGGTIWRVSYGG